MSESAALLARYAEVRQRLYGPRPVARRQVAPVLETVVLPFPVIDATTPVPLNLLGRSSWRFLVAYAALKHGVEVEDILSPLRSRPVVAARHEALHLCRTHMRISLTRLGLYFGRDHTTILTGLKRYEKRKGLLPLSPLSTVFTGENEMSLTQETVGQDASC